MAASRISDPGVTVGSEHTVSSLMPLYLIPTVGAGTATWPAQGIYLSSLGVALMDTVLATRWRTRVDKAKC